jgi:hypothetical protein
VFGDSPRREILSGGSEQAMLMPDLFEPRKAGSTYGHLRSLFALCPDRPRKSFGSYCIRCNSGHFLERRFPSSARYDRPR